MIRDPYLLVLNLPLWRSAEGYLAEPLWRKDLLLHLDQIERLTLACPVEHGPPPADAAPVSHPRLTIVPLPPMRRTSLLRLPELAYRIDRAARGSRIVHTGVAGWPFPLGWLAAPIARRRGRFLTIVVESSFWRVPDGVRASPLRRLRAAVTEEVNRACVNACDISFFTSSGYRDSLATDPRGATAVAPASWVDADQVLGDGEADRAWAAKPQRFLFAGRLTDQKGVGVLLAALDRGDVAVDIIGAGERLDDCRALAARHPDRIRLLDPVPYGHAFFRLLDGYAALVLPTLSDEQPRILLDAAARAVPAIASATSGVRDLVADGVTGLLVPPGDPAALADALARAAGDRAGLRAMGMAALGASRSHTHQAMHRTRAEAIAEALAPGPGRAALAAA